LKNSFSVSTKNFSRSQRRMLSQSQRTTILELDRQGVGKREIARVLGISRVAVRRVLRSNSTAVPELPRAEKANRTGSRSWRFSTPARGSGTAGRTITDDTLPGGVRERVITYVAPFDRCDREADYATAWSFFERNRK
jgi:hypothetical protein